MSQTTASKTTSVPVFQLLKELGMEECIVGKKIYATQDQARAFLLSRGVPRRYVDARITEFSAEQFPFSNGDLEEKSFYVYGPVGCGKTHLLCSLLRETSYGTSSRFLTSEELLSSIKDSYGKPFVPRWMQEEDEARIDNIVTKLCDVDVLAIDDLGLERVTEWSMSMMRLIINSRYNDMRRTYISSNMDLDSMAKCFDQRIASRIYQMCEVVHMSSKEDKRTSKRKRKGS